MTTKIAGWLEMDRGNAIGAGLAGVGAGLGARGLKRLLELYRGEDYKAPVDLPAVHRPVVKLPVTVSPEEAAELERRGQKVRHIKAAGINNILDYMTAGGLAAGGAYGGWKLLDNYFNKQRTDLAKKNLDAVKNRVTRLLSDNPTNQDIPLHAQMKAAEDHFFAKQAFPSMAGVLGQGVLALSSPLAPLGAAAGILGTIMAVRAYNKSEQSNKYRQSINSIRDYYNRKSVQSPDAELEPVVVDPLDKDPIAAAKPIEGPNNPVAQPAIHFPKAAALGQLLKARHNGRLS